MGINTDYIRDVMSDGDWRRVHVKDTYDSHEEILPGDVWLVPGGGVAEITYASYDDEPAGTEVCVAYHDRETPGEHGPDVYERETTAKSLMARMDADGGWERVPPTVYADGPVVCPNCGVFMSLMPTTGPNTEPFATAQCRDGHLKHHDELVDDGEAKEVLI